MSPCEENSKPVCHRSPHPLRELALTKTALNIWLQKFDKFYKRGHNSHVKITELDFRSDRSTAIPLQINEIIDARMYYIAVELDMWVTYAISAIKYLSYSQIYSRLNLVVFGGNCKIHYRHTIANFLEDDSLHYKTKFKIACVNCIEEKIDFFWPLVSSTLIIGNFKFDDDFMLCYWVRRKKGELHEIEIPARFRSIERLMIDKCRQKRIHLAVEYFLKLLNSNDQFAELSKLVDPIVGFVRVNQFYRYQGLEIFTNIFPNIDGPMQRRIFDKYSVNILDYFLVYLQPVEYTVQIFLYIKDVLTFERYCDILKLYFEILKNNPHYDNNEIPEKKLGFWYKQIDIAMEQIWLNTPPYLKQYALKNLSTILNEYDMYSYKWLEYFGHDFKFLLAVISNGSVQLRNNVWMRYWPEWILDVTPSKFEELMELYLVETEVIEEFKNTFPYTEDFKYCCSRLICDGHFIELDEFFSYLYSNPKLILKIKKYILTNETKIFYEELEAVEKYAKYIDNLFSDDVLAADFKDNLIFSDPVVKALLQAGIGTHSVDNLSDMISMVSLFVSPQKHKEIKSKFLELFRDMITSGELGFFNESLWGELVLWCSDNNEQRIEDFMKLVQIDDAFEAAFSRHLRLGEYLRNRFNTSFNRFLVWFFKSKSMSVNYIREKIEYYESMDDVNVERIFMTDKQTVIDSIKNELLKKVITLKW